MSSYQKGFIEFKGARKLPGELVNTVKPLKKHWTSLVFIMILSMTTPIGKAMTKLQPFTSHQNLESLIGKNNDSIQKENSCMKSETNVGLHKLSQNKEFSVGFKVKLNVEVMNQLSVTKPKPA